MLVSDGRRDLELREVVGMIGDGVPALVLCGELDEPFLAAARYMARKLPNATSVILEGAGHAANLDRPKGFNAAVLSFLEDALAERA